MTEEEKELRKTLGANIKARRISKGLTQEKLAEAAEISLAFCAQIEGGNRCPSVPVLVQLATALDASIDALVNLNVRPLAENEVKEILGDKNNKYAEFITGLMEYLSNWVIEYKYKN